jgi:uncharacterized protein
MWGVRVPVRAGRQLLAVALVSALLLVAGSRSHASSAGTRIFEIQGAGHIAPLAGQQVQHVPGVVTSVRPNGFTLQDEQGDGRTETSDAVLVFTREVPTVVVGDRVRVSGVIGEFRPGGDEHNLSVTEIVEPTVKLVASGVPLPAAVELGPGGRLIPPLVTLDGVSGDVELAADFAPDISALDFFESLEGMRVQVADAVIVGLRDGRGELAVLPADGAGVVRRTVGGGVLAAPPGEAPPSVVLVDGAVRTPPASIGDRLSGLTTGIVEHAFGGYRVRVEALPSLVLGGHQPERAATIADPEILTVATFNVENLGPRERPARLARLAETAVDRLASPDLLVLQEIQDDSGPADDGVVTGGRTAGRLAEAILAAGGPAYQYREIAPENNQDGGEPGANIRVGLLYREDRGLALVERPGGDAVTPVSVVRSGPATHLSVSPGRIAPASPVWTESRRPLAAEFTFNGRRLVVIGCHFVSKRGDQPRFGRFQPPASPTQAQRLAQAHEVHQFARALLQADQDAHLLVLGDLNDTPGSATLTELAGGLLTNLVVQLPEAEQYTYVFGGQSEAIDHIVVSPALLRALEEVDIVHGNADMPGAPSDHDPVLARFRLSGR